MIFSKNVKIWELFERCVGWRSLWELQSEVTVFFGSKSNISLQKFTKNDDKWIQENVFLI